MYRYTCLNCCYSVIIFQNSLTKPKFSSRHSPKIFIKSLGFVIYSVITKTFSTDKLIFSVDRVMFLIDGLKWFLCRINYCPASVSLKRCHTKTNFLHKNMYSVTVSSGHHDYPGFQLDIS